MDYGQTLSECSRFAEESSNKLGRDYFKMPINVKVDVFISSIGMKSGKKSVIRLFLLHGIHWRLVLVLWGKLENNWSNISHNGVLIGRRPSCVQQGPSLSEALRNTFLNTGTRRPNSSYQMYPSPKLGTLIDMGNEGILF